MPSEELGRVLLMPVSCKHCPKYSEQPAAFLIDSEKFTCPSCQGEIDLTTKEWFAFRRKLAEVLQELQPLYSSFHNDTLQRQTKREGYRKRLPAPRGYGRAARRPQQQTRRHVRIPHSPRHQTAARSRPACRGSMPTKWMSSNERRPSICF
jgi:hypothetical protein